MTNAERRHNPADMHKRHLDHRLYDDEFRELNRKVLQEVFYGFAVIVLPLLVLLYALA